MNSSEKCGTQQIKHYAAACGSQEKKSYKSKWQPKDAFLSFFDLELSVKKFYVSTHKAKSAKGCCSRTG